VRHYPISVKTGSAVEMLPSVDIGNWTFSGSGTLPTQRYGSVTTTGYTGTFSLTTPTDASESMKVRGLAADGQEFSFELTVTQ
jgi:hypothetical protein